MFYINDNWVIQRGYSWKSFISVKYIVLFHEEFVIKFFDGIIIGYDSVHDNSERFRTNDKNLIIKKMETP